MADIDDLKVLLARWNVPLHERTDGTGDRMVYVGNYDGDDDSGGYGSVRLPSADAVEGYSGFYTRFVFTTDGTFKKLGAWE